MLGAVKRIFHLLLGEKDVEYLEQFIKLIKLPTHVRRLTRPLTDKKFWTAKDWENFLLYYSLPLLSLVVEKKYLEYWALLIEGIHILLGTRITHADAIKANKLLRKFVYDTQYYFKEPAMYYNIHLLLHIAQTVLDWGPLWANSAFAFETANHWLIRAIKNARGATLQIQRFINMSFCTSILEKKVFENTSEIGKHYCLDLLKTRVKFAVRINDTTTFLGKGELIEKELANTYLLDERSVCFKKSIKDDCLYAFCTKINKKSDNSVAQLKNGNYILIKYFVIDESTKEAYILCDSIKTKRQKITNLNVTTLRIIDEINPSATKININELETICAAFVVNGVQYICRLPNLVSY